MDLNKYKHISAGILCFFDDGKTVLLGREYRYKMNQYYYSEFGGKCENGETLYETAFRECNEETGYSLDLTLEMVHNAEKSGHYVDYINDRSLVFYRMYCVKFVKKPSPRKIQINKEAQPKGEYEEMVEWRYFNTNNVVNQGKLINTDVKLFPPLVQRLKLLRMSGFFNTFK